MKLHYGEPGDEAVADGSCLDPRGAPAGTSGRAEVLGRGGEFDLLLGVDADAVSRPSQLVRHSKDEIRLARRRVTLAVHQLLQPREGGGPLEGFDRDLLREAEFRDDFALEERAFLACASPWDGCVGVKDLGNPLGRGGSGSVRGDADDEEIIEEGEVGFGCVGVLSLVEPVGVGGRVRQRGREEEPQCGCLTTVMTR